MMNKDWLEEQLNNMGRKSTIKCLNYINEQNNLRTNIFLDLINYPNLLEIKFDNDDLNSPLIELKTQKRYDNICVYLYEKLDVMALVDLIEDEYHIMSTEEQFKLEEIIEKGAKDLEIDVREIGL